MDQTLISSMVITTLTVYKALLTQTELWLESAASFMLNFSGSFIRCLATG